MGVSIANLSVVFSASTAGMTGGLKLGTKALNSMRASVNGLSAGVTGAIGKIGVLGGVVAGVAGAGSLGALVKSQFDAVDAMGNLSQQTGITTESLSAMKWAANQADVPFESLTAAIAKMTVNLGEAKSGSGGTADALTSLGLSAVALSKLSPDEAFKQISDALAGITDPYTRANAAQAIFGKGAKDVMNLLTAGSGVYAQAATDVEMFGTNVSDIDVAKIDLADQSFKKVQEAVSGVAMRVAVELAPYIAAATDGLVSFITSGEGLKSYVVPAIAAVATGVGYVVDGWSLLSAGVNVVQAGIAFFGAGAIDTVATVLDGVNYLITGWNSVANAVGLTSATVSQIDVESVRGLGDAFNDVAKEALEAADANFNEAANAKGRKAVESWARDVANAANTAGADIAATNAALRNQAKVETKNSLEVDGLKSADDALKKIHEQIDAIGATDIEVKLKAFAEIPGIGAEKIAQYQAALNELDAKKLGDDLKKQIRTPIDDAEDQMKKIGTALAAGTITSAEAEQLTANVKTKLEDVAGVADVTNPNRTLVRSGSAEAMMIADGSANRAAGRNGANDKVQKQVELAKSANAYLGKIETALKNGLTPQIAYL